MTVQTQIEELVQSKLEGKRIQPVSLVEELLVLASQEGEIQCTLANNEAFRFTIPCRQQVFEVPVDRALGKLRMMCARLAKLCQESGQEFLPYGGEGIITRAPALATRQINESARADSGLAIPIVPRMPVPIADGVAATVAPAVLPSQQQWKVRFKNTMHEQEFNIQAL